MAEQCLQYQGLLQLHLPPVGEALNTKASGVFIQPPHQADLPSPPIAHEGLQWAPGLQEGTLQLLLQQVLHDHAVHLWHLKVCCGL